MKPTIASILRESAQRNGARTALVSAGAELRYEEILERTARFAGGLRKIGLKPGDRIVIYVANGWEWIVAYYASAFIGAVVVPANILLNVNEVAFLAKDSEASAIILAGAHKGDVQAAISAEAVAVRHLIVIGDSEMTNSVSFDFLLDSQPADPHDSDPEDLFTIGYTSGTTGKPKGAMLTHRGIYLSTALTATMHLRDSRDVCVSALPLPHVYGNVVMHAAFMTGMKLVLFPRFDAAEVLDAISRYKATILDGVPTMYYYLLSHPGATKEALQSLTRCTVGGQTMPASKIQAVEALFECPLLELWGMTEVGGPAISHSPYLPSRHGSAGTAFPTMQTRIIDNDDPSREMPLGETGELVIRGPLVMTGYYKNEEATRETMLSGGWMRTGDLACQDSDGYVFIVDRKKDMIITGGYNIYPAELEAVIATHPAVAMVAVAAIADENKGELAKAFIVLKPDSTATEDDIFTHCRKHLGAYKIPRRLAFVDDLPKTSTGKIMRRALSERASDAQVV